MSTTNSTNSANSANSQTDPIVLTRPMPAPRRRRLLPRVPARYEGWLFVAPLVVGIGVFQAYPLLVSLWSSFTDWDGLSTQQFIGLDNYITMLTDSTLLDSVVTTIIFTVVSIPISVGLALLLALLCNGRNIRGTSLFRMAYFTPYVTSIVAVSLVFMQFFAPDGLANSALGVFGVEGTDWLTNSTTALWVVILVAVWQGVGYPMVILLAGLQGIPRDLYEAAKVDGATSRRRLVSITLPLLTPQLFFVLITQFILSFQVFAVIFVMTRGGPGTSTSVFIYYLYQNAFAFGQLGYASAMAWVMFAFILLVTLFQWRLQKRWVFYG
jgi:multiple sugar transport system permease protein